MSSAHCGCRAWVRRLLHRPEGAGFEKSNWNYLLTNQKIKASKALAMPKLSLVKADLSMVSQDKSKPAFRTVSPHTH